MAENQLENIYRFYENRRGPRPDVWTPWLKILETGHGPNEEWTPLRDGRRTSPLFSAVLDGSLQLMELLLDRGARLEDHNREGRTVLHEAVLRGVQDNVLLLLDRGANAESHIIDGFLCGGTALHLAVTEGLVDVVKSLLDHGCDPRARTKIGWTPVDIAVLDHQTTILDLLLKSLLTVSDSASENEICSHENIKDDSDPAAIACHLLEHGVWATGPRHVHSFQGRLSRIMKERFSATTSSLELSTVIIVEMEAHLRSESGMTGDIAWSRNLCEDCVRFENQDSYNVCQIYEHKPDLASLMSSSNNGCNLCHLFVNSLENHWCLLQQIERKWLDEFGESPKVRLMVHRRDKETSKLGEYRLIVVCGEKIAFTDLGHVQRQLNTAVADTAPSDTEGTFSDRSLALASAWLQRCEDEHVSCKRLQLGRLPKRAIDVGSASNEPRIYVSARERVPYVALSYCWGQHTNVRLLSTNIDAYKRCLPLANLPQTIADAVLVARRMNVKYLWVDSLCILQDSESDMREELSYMGDIYTDAWFTIAAKESPSCTSGLFHQRNWPTSAIVPTEIRLQETAMQRDASVQDRTKNTRTSCSNRVMALPRHPKSSEKEDVPVLYTRGWALQEEILSRRILNCGKLELSLTCLQGSCTERQPEEKDVKIWHNSQYVIKRALVTGPASPANPDRVNKDAIFNYWLDVVEDFLRRKLSEPRDKLAALTGIQDAIGKVLDDESVAGIWRKRFFAPSLLWRIQNPFPCPSWSWASRPGSVKYVRHPSGTDNSRPWVWHNEVKYCPEVVSQNIDDKGPHGIDGYVTVRCKLVREADLDCEKHVVQDFLNAPPRSRNGKEAIHSETHDDFKGAAAISDSWLMLVRTNQVIPGMKDRGYKYDIETHLLRLEKISADRPDFRRIGLVVTRSWANRWLQRATDENIRLF